MAALGMGGTAYAFGLEPHVRLVVSEWTVPHAHWPKDMPPLRIAVLTDIHASDPWMPAARIGAIVERTNMLKPDVILLLGDYVAAMSSYGTTDIPIGDWTAELGRLRAPLGVYAVLGNHDWWTDPDGVRGGLEREGIRVLENDALRLKVHGDPVWRGGLGDQLALRGKGRRRGVDDLPATLAPARRDDAPYILMVHEPDIFTRVPQRVTLTLAGHTHGGQVNLPFVGRPIIPSNYGQRFAYGHIVEDGCHLLVSSGLGLSGVPVRFMVPPEIALVTLTSVQDSAAAHS
jgi:predicted MPP superfamily phosphohydrolase